MKIEKANKNSYRIRKSYKGKVYSITVPYKPTQKEAIELMAERLNKVNINAKHMTFSQAYYAYIETKHNVLSPSTVRGYESIYNVLPEDFKNQNINDLTEVDIQKLVNDYSATHSPKTTFNMYSFVKAVLGLFRPHFIFKVTLPQRIKNEPYIPTEADIKAIMEYAKGTNYEVALKLACLGLRRSEICALTMDDINGNELTINKAMVQDESRKWVIKTTKTTDSTRTIYVSDDIVALINEKGFFKCHPANITKFLYKTQKELGIPQFGIHKLRHFFASYAHLLGVSDKYIMEAGGWRTATTLNQVYKHALADRSKEIQKEIASKLSDLF